MKTKIQPVLEQLKKSGIRITPQRHAIFAYLLAVDTHPTADEIYRALEGKFPNMSIATVYNNLRLFVEVELIQELTYGDDASRFDANIANHYHIMCNQCNKIVDLFIPNIEWIEQLAMKDTGFMIEGHRMELHGTCPACTAATNE